MAVTYEELGIFVPPGSSGQIKAYCPECRDKRTNRFDKSLSVKLDEQCWNCHYCGWAGYLENFNGGKRDWRESARPIAPKTYTRPDPIPDNPALTGRAADFLARRGLASVSRVFRLYGDDEAINIPYYRDGELVNVKTRYLGGPDMKSGHRMTTGAEPIWFNLDNCKGQKTIAITEGEWDAMALHGIVPALSVPNGGTKGKANLGFFASGADIIEAADVILIAVDTDEVGSVLESELVRRIGPEKCKRVRWTTGKDANDVLRDAGADALRRCVENAEPYPVEGMVRAVDMLDEYRHLYEFGLSRGDSAGIPAIDPLYTILPGYLTCVTGTPGVGKSELLDQFIINTGRDYDWNWTVFSPESEPREEHISRMAEKLSGLPFFSGAHQRMSWETAEKALQWIDQHVMFLSPEEPTVDELVKMIRADVLRRGSKCFIIDPWNEVIHTPDKYQRNDQYLSAQFRTIRRVAERTRSHGFLVNHPHALTIGKDGQYPVVKHYDLNEGAMWANKMAAILSVWRDRIDLEKPVELHVLKTKTRRIGRPGVARLTYDRVSGTYSGGSYEFRG